MNLLTNQRQHPHPVPYPLGHKPLCGFYEARSETEPKDVRLCNGSLVRPTAALYVSPQSL